VPFNPGTRPGVSNEKLLPRSQVLEGTDRPEATVPSREPNLRYEAMPGKMAPLSGVKVGCRFRSCFLRFPNLYNPD
jgi:hypothetical protein